MDRKMLAFDVVVLVVYLAAANPAITGIGVHEWLGLGVCLVLDALIAAALAVCAVSGVMVSGAVLPAFGLYAEGYFFWDPLHAASAKVLLALLLVHVVVHWRWLAGFFGKGKKRKAADLYRY